MRVCLGVIRSQMETPRSLPSPIFASIVVVVAQPWRGLGTGLLVHDLQCLIDFFFVIFLQRRRAARQQQSKKVGVRYYETHNVKNRNRNKKKNDSEGQKHKHKKFRQKQ